MKVSKFKIGQVYTLPDGKTIEVLDKSNTSIRIHEWFRNNVSNYHYDLQRKVWRTVKIATVNGKTHECVCSRGYVILANG